MATKRPGRQERGQVLRINATIEPDADGRQPEALAAYAFSNGGKLLRTVPLEGGAAELDLPVGKEASGARVLVGPQLEDPDLVELVRLGAVERHIRVERDMPRLDLTIIPDDWRCWLLSRCSVRGTLLKRTERGGQPLDLPVCGATVEIYEVDPIRILIPQLPDEIIDLIPDILDDPIPDPIPDPWPDPFPGGPFPGPFPGPDPTPFIRSKEASSRLAERFEAAPVPADLRMAARSGSRVQLRNALILHPDITRPLLCRYWPRLITKTLIGTAKTDDCGHWTFSFFRGCRNPDEPDLYFRATQRWLFGDRVIYDPKPIACHTYWDFKCGSEVTLYTTDPFARTCAPCPPIVAGDDWVLVMHIGNLPVSNIRGVAQDLADTTDDTNRGLTVAGEPFGGVLRPHLEFDPDLLNQHGIRFYGVSVRKAGESDDAWIELNRPVHRNYVYESGDNPVIAPYVLGPEYAADDTTPLYRIPPSVPPQGIWTIADAVQNMANAHWHSEELAPHVDAPAADKAGKYEMRIQLFHADGAPVDIGALGIRWLVPKEKNLAAPTVIHTEAPAAGVVQPDGSFIMTLHVDNNRCRAEIDPPTLNGSAASDACGVMRYSPAGGTVTLPYRALHRNGFATHYLLVKRGTNQLTPPSGGGATGSFAPTDTVSNLLRPIPPATEGCTIGAFLEVLDVHPRATDGWSTQLHYAARDERAFTLAPSTA